MKPNILFLFALLIISAINGFAQKSQHLLMRQPTMNKTHIVFSYAGDLWVVQKQGGEAQRLTTGIGLEQYPRFSPDGNFIAFTGEYDGNFDVYTIPATGGEPKRLTYHPEVDYVANWTPDSKQVLFTSTRNSESYRIWKLYTIPVDGVFPQQVPLPMAWGGTYSPDGKQLAYTPLPDTWYPSLNASYPPSNFFHGWKRYRGGYASVIWIANLADSSIEKIPNDGANDCNPMWSPSEPNKIYFLSDHDRPVTLFSYDIKTKKKTRLIENKGLDIKSASIFEDGIVYEQFGSIWIYDLKSGKNNRVNINININGDIESVRQKIDKVGNKIINAGLSPTGSQAVFEARGEILTVPADKGDIRNLTNTSGMAERFPAWSPDGKWIAYFSDEGGEYSLHLRDQKGFVEVKKIKLQDYPAFYFSPIWSPDSKKIAYTDTNLNMWYVDIDNGITVKVDTARRGEGTPTPTWSPDSRWLVYTKALKSWYEAVFIYSLEDRSINQITDGMSNAGSPVFDKNGKYLYFTASTDIGPSFSYEDMSVYSYKATYSIYACVLRKDLPSPIDLEGNVEKILKENKADGDKTPVEKVEIDFDRINKRIVALPIPNRMYIKIDAGKPGMLYIQERTSDRGQLPIVYTLHKYDFESRNFEKIIDNLDSYVISANGENLMYRQRRNWFIVSMLQPVKAGEGKIRTEAMEVNVDPVAEWKQMYREAFRLERDFFYDRQMHGLDLQETFKRYEPFLDSLSHRIDLNYLLSEIFGELSVGHLIILGGDWPHLDNVPVGLLGADYKIENGRYRIVRIFDGESWNPNVKAPLAQLGRNVNEGEYLLAVNGRNLTANDNLYSFFQATAGKQITIKVGPDADGTNSRDILVIPVDSENALRNLAWIESNRLKVNQLSGGKLAYIYIPDTVRAGGYTSFNRYFFSQRDKDGAVIDERFNRGGNLADYIIDYLKKPVMSYWAFRNGEDGRRPFGTMLGPKAMLVNEFSGSGGDYLPWMFRKAKVGPLIGKRTWGGLVGTENIPLPRLIDGGLVLTPSAAFYTPEGEWDVENKGVAPDIEVEMDPKAWRQGRDTQLEKAVKVLMDELKKNPVEKVHRPAPRNYHNGKQMN